jgi:hypothetical protein
MANAVIADASPAKEIAPVAGIRFTVASRNQRRFSVQQSVDNASAGGSFQPISLNATGWVRRIEMLFTFATTYASAGALVAGDGPWNMVAAVTLTDATGQPIIQPISGYNLYLVNKYFASSAPVGTKALPWQSPQAGPEYNYAATGTSGTAVFRLSLNLEQDFNSGYGCVPNLDANASLQLKIDYAASTVAFTGTTQSATSLQLLVDQHYYAMVSPTLGGAPVNANPPGMGDYLETRYETQPVTASTENIVNVTNRGGLIRGIIAISRAAGVRTAFTTATNVGLILDNNPIDEGIKLAAFQNYMRQTYGYMGANIATSYAPITAGTTPGIDNGVLVWNEADMGGGRDNWLSTRTGSLLQLKVTPGTSATQLELITDIMQVGDMNTFYAPSALV